MRREYSGTGAMETIMELREIPVDDLVLDPNLNLRDRLDDFTVERYAESWDRMPPITVFEIEGRFLIADGFHRHAAAIMLDRRRMSVEVRQGTISEAMDYVAGVNLFHGLPLTRAERRRAVEVKLRLHHDWSDRRLAEELGAGREMIAKIRKQLVDAGQVPATGSRIGADGKTYPSVGLPRDPNEHLPKGNSIAQQDDPRDRGAREADSWDDTIDPLPPVKSELPAAPWDVPSAKEVALGPPIPAAAPTINEMLEMMANQVMDVITWTKAEGFGEAYREAGSNSRGLFHSAVLKLAARADQLRRA
ncbi:ParB N-terminal domain-containing protein [Tundrisphaera lichenicola]|uniref:ParB N-terminal domain-containing protein n=1 Tax=Tundrisphaera lichenicola TaxID=2029860 RepID=UPI003EBD374A